MKYFTLILFVIFTVGCSQSVNKKANEKHVKTMLTDFLVAIEDNDYDKLEQITDSDFVIYENGSIWNLDRLSTELEGFQDIGVSYKVHDMHAIVDENVAHLQFMNTGEFVYPDTTLILEFIESATFIRNNNHQWHLRFYHSTHLKRSADNK